MNLPPELNTLSDLRGSFHHLTIQINDPEWRQEEQPFRLIKVDTEEVESPSLFIYKNRFVYYPS